ncbi:MAG: arylamine N-acetyltransferase family protein [Alcanivorax sp.]|uniref:arylamine N-acetyltransferase family protein n=1 Tax=Alcanivorax sp. TaxID=1872427 RepID=UPI003DA71098
MALDIDAYLQRIGYQGEKQPTLNTLKALQRLHLQAITFENLNPLLGLPVPLDNQALMDKLVLQRRGGYCFENNLLFLEVLTTLGFQARGITGRVYWNQPDDAWPPRSHMVLLVTIDGEDYLSDVGFGGMTPTAPLKLHARHPQSTPLESFRVESHQDHYSLWVQLGDQWRLLYRFDLMKQERVDFEMANWYVACHPQSKFVNNLIAVRTGEDRRHTLLNDLYTVRFPDGSSEKHTLNSTAELRELLEGVFAINMAGIDRKKLEKALKEKSLFQQ